MDSAPASGRITRGTTVPSGAGTVVTADSDLDVGLDSVWDSPASDWDTAIRGAMAWAALASVDTAWVDTAWVDTA